MSDSDWRQVRVTFRKAVSDGNYGTESAEVTLETYVGDAIDGEHDQAIATDLLHEARSVVHAELERSPSQRVRSAIDHSVSAHALQ